MTTTRSRSHPPFTGPAMSRRAAAAWATALLFGSIALPARATDDLWQKSRAMYAGLRSYSDTGVVLSEYGSGSKDRHTFTTYINRVPRRFLLEFRKQGGDRYAIWGDPQAFHTWWQTTGMLDDYPNPNNTPAFSTAGFQTAGAANIVPTLWFSNSGLQGPLTNFTDPVPDGTEEIDGRRCHRLIGSTRDVYVATGREVNVRKLTVWIDAESLLIRKVLEVPKDQLPGQTKRWTTTYEPRANPVLDEASFRFVVPPRK